MRVLGRVPITSSREDAKTVNCLSLVSERANSFHTCLQWTMNTQNKYFSKTSKIIDQNDLYCFSKLFVHYVASYFILSISLMRMKSKTNSVETNLSLTSPYKEQRQLDKCLIYAANRSSLSIIKLYASTVSIILVVNFLLYEIFHNVLSVVL